MISAGEIERTIAGLLARHGRTFCEELGIPIALNTPDALFRWLVAAILFDARIRWSVALAAARAVFGRGWTTAERLAASTWEERVRALDAAGYARYDESTARELGADAAFALTRYGGDLRRLRAAAGRDPKRERALLDEFPGLGPVGVDIFCREAQAAWPELHPFLDRRARDAAGRLGLPDDAAVLARHVPKQDFARLATALARSDLAGEADVPAPRDKA